MNALHLQNETATRCYDAVRRVRDDCGGLDKAKQNVEAILGRPLTDEGNINSEVQTLTTWYNLARNIKLTDEELDEEESLGKGGDYGSRLSDWLAKLRNKHRLMNDEPFTYQSRETQRLNAGLRRK